jgi:hypothetical protein
VALTLTLSGTFQTERWFSVLVPLFRFEEINEGSGTPGRTQGFRQMLQWSYILEEEKTVSKSRDSFTFFNGRHLDYLGNYYKGLQEEWREEDS